MPDPGDWDTQLGCGGAGVAATRQRAAPGAEGPRVPTRLRRGTAVQVLRDIADPDGGIYSFRDPMESRLSYVRWQMDGILEDPMIKVSMLDRGAPHLARPRPPCAHHAAHPCM